MPPAYLPATHTETFLFSLSAGASLAGAPPTWRPTVGIRGGGRDQITPRAAALLLMTRTCVCTGGCNF